MGFVFKSALGLGVVYYAMFSQAPHTGDRPPAVSACATAARVALSGEEGLRGSLATVNCASALTAIAPKLAPAPVAVPVAAKAAPTVAAASTLRGSLTGADLETPWFGPSHILRRGLRG